MYHEIQAEDETHSKKSASTGSSSAIKSRSRVKSMSKHDQFIRLTHFLFAIKSGLGVKSGWRLDILFTLVLLFIVLETDFLLYVLSPAWISWYIFSTLFTTFRPIKSTLYSVFYRDTFQCFPLSLNWPNFWCYGSGSAGTGKLLNGRMPAENTFQFEFPRCLGIFLKF